MKGIKIVLPLLLATAVSLTCVGPTQSETGEDWPPSVSHRGSKRENKEHKEVPMTQTQEGETKDS